MSSAVIESNFNSRFFRRKKSFLTLEKIAEITGAILPAKVDLEQRIFDIKTLKEATSADISFFHSAQYGDDFLASKAGFCFGANASIAKAPTGMKILAHKNPYFAHAKIIAEFYEAILPDFAGDAQIHPLAEIGKNCHISPKSYIGKNVILGEGSHVAAGAVIMDGCVIGKNCKINPNSTISFARIGDNCEIYNGAQIGQDGFGFVHEAGKNHKILQIGIVEIGNEVEIGANSCVDRGAIGNTVIHDGVKIDNLCQIAHNVEIGSGTVIAGGSGIAGSTKIGRFVQIGGGCNIGGHIKIGDGVKIAGMSGVMRDIEPAQIMAGIPVLPIKKWHRINAMLLKMMEGKNPQK